LVPVTSTRGVADAEVIGTDGDSDLAVVSAVGRAFASGATGSMKDSSTPLRSDRNDDGAGFSDSQWWV
jgi:hypothetical protein